MRVFLLAMVGLFCILQYRLWYADGSVVHRQRLASQLETQLAANDKLRERNAELNAQVKDLRSGSEAIEALARSELGLVKQGETFYQVVEPLPDRPSAAAAKAPSLSKQARSRAAENQKSAPVARQLVGPTSESVATESAIHATTVASTNSGSLLRDSAASVEKDESVDPALISPWVATEPPTSVPSRSQVHSADKQ